MKTKAEFNVLHAQQEGNAPLRIRDDHPLRARLRENMCREGSKPSAEVISSSGVTFHLWRLYQHFWLLCLFFPLASLGDKPLVTLRLALEVLALIFFAGGYTWIMWPHPVNQGAQTRTRSRLSSLLLVILALQITVLSLVDGPAWLWLFIGISAMAGVLFPMRQAGIVVVLLTLLPLLITLVSHRGVIGVDWWWLIALMLLVRGLGLDMVGVARMGSAIWDLHTARLELARLKVEEERLRLARDLHDLLGQTLSLITLKSELARNLVREEPERCAQELAEIERVSRQTLREVREAVAGYKQPHLSSELEGARQLLLAAGIDYQVETLKEPLPPAFDATLAWAVREGVTNVVRHSHARSCKITLKEGNKHVSAEILNDGTALEQIESLSSQTGLGLAGLSERVTLLGGHMQAGPLSCSPKEGFRLRVELPISSQKLNQRLQRESQ